MGSLKEKLYEELKLKLTLFIEGVSYEEGTFDKLINNDNTLKKQEYCTWDKELVSKKSFNLPYAFTLENGSGVPIVVDRNSPYKIEENGGVFSLSHKSKKISLEYLASIGVVTVASSWIPGIGSPLEGHRSPTVDWHWDVQLKHANILRKYGRTYEEIFNATPNRNFVHEIYQIEDETLPIFRNQELLVK